MRYITNEKYYYTINEEAARRAKEMISFSDYDPGSLTAEYRRMVDKAVAVAENHKHNTDSMHHEKIDYYLDLYCRKLADNFNQSSAITARVPSVMIAGPANFPTRKKEQQNAAMNKNMEEYNHIQGLLDKIQSIGMGGISSDDKEAVTKLESKLHNLEKSHDSMKKLNAYYRKHGTCVEFDGLSEQEAKRFDAKVEKAYSWEKQPYPSYVLSGNTAEMRRLKGRIEELKQRDAIPEDAGWKFDGGEVVLNKEQNRVQIFHDEKPSEDVRKGLKSHGFRWSPKATAWQRQLTGNGIYAAKKVTGFTGKIQVTKKASEPEL